MDKVLILLLLGNAACAAPDVTQDAPVEIELSGDSEQVLAFLGDLGASVAFLGGIPTGGDTATPVPANLGPLAELLGLGDLEDRKIREYIEGLDLPSCTALDSVENRVVDLSLHDCALVTGNSLAGAIEAALAESCSTFGVAQAHFDIELGNWTGSGVLTPTNELDAQVQASFATQLEGESLGAELQTCISRDVEAGEAILSGAIDFPESGTRFEFSELHWRGCDALPYAGSLRISNDDREAVIAFSAQSAMEGLVAVSAFGEEVVVPLSLHRESLCEQAPPSSTPEARTRCGLCEEAQ